MAQKIYVLKIVKRGFFSETLNEKLKAFGTPKVDMTFPSILSAIWHGNYYHSARLRNTNHILDNYPRIRAVFKNFRTKY
jgi:hypothetical protein